MQNAQLALRKGLKKLNRSLAKSKSNHLLFLALFVFGILLIVVFWARLAKMVHIF